MAAKLKYPPDLKCLKNRFNYFIIPSEYQKDRLTCVICEDILIEPHQSLCGCRICESCVNKYIDDVKKCCPGCNDVLKVTDKNITRDKAVEKEIFELEILCINEECNEKCKLKCLVDHLEICEHREKKCAACDELYLYSGEKEHILVNCPSSTSKCVDCGREMSRKNLNETHRNVDGCINDLCDNWRSVCPCGCCEEVQNNVKIHLVVCPRLSVACVYKYIGCTKMCPRCDMDDHVRDDVGCHMELFMVEVGRLRRENDEIKTAMLERDREMRLEIDVLKKTVEDSSSQIKILTQRILSAESKYVGQETDGNTLRQSLNFFTRSSRIISDKSSSPPTVVSLGQYSWVIENIEQVVKKAKRGADMQIFSEHFYTGNPGYKICLKAYPNGDGKASGDHFSLFFVIMKGEYDDQLSWPFNQKVSLSLLSHGTARGNLTVNMKPDLNENCYGKPKTQYNLAAGQPHFVSHVEMARYVHNGAITILARII